MSEDYIKDFKGWHKLKALLNNSKNLPTFNEREIWWCSIGVNVGFESDGKNQPFHRPVLVLKKFNRRIFVGIPLTTQIKEIDYYHPFQFKGRDQCAILCQIRLFDNKRLTDKMGWVSPKPFQEIREAVKTML